MGTKILGVIAFAAIAAVLCEAVGELHAGFAAAGEPGVPVIHRDLKPSNIIVSGVRYAADAGMIFSSLVIIDLGIARVWRDGADADTVKFGTRSYAPPEQFGFGQTSVRSDIYALGALLFFCLTGDDPKPGRDMREQCEAHGIPVPLADVICMAMALDPAKRFASAKALGHAARAAYDLCAPVSSLITAPAAAVSASASGATTGCPCAFAFCRSVFGYLALGVRVLGVQMCASALAYPRVRGAHMEWMRLCDNIVAADGQPFCGIYANGRKPKLSNVVFGA